MFFASYEFKLLADAGVARFVRATVEPLAPLACPAGVEGPGGMLLEWAVEAVAAEAIDARVDEAGRPIPAVVIFEDTEELAAGFGLLIGPVRGIEPPPRRFAAFPATFPAPAGERLKPRRCSVWF